MYLRFLKSLLTHKWYVLLAGLRTGVPLWRLIVHDWQKFTPTEFIAYARYFQGGKKEEDKEKFLYAWVHHVRYGPHHWEHWLLNPGYNFSVAVDGCVPMPETYVREMVADWLGASRAYTGSWDMVDWVYENVPKMTLHPKTRETLDKILPLAEW